MTKISGVAVGIVREVQDPLDLGRVRVNFPWLDPKHITDWVRVASLYGGPDKGSHFVPDVGDEVLLAFEQGNPRIPYIIGALWNGKDKPPCKDVRERRLQSKNGHSIRLYDTPPERGDKGAIVIQDAHGNRITLSNGKVTISSVAILELDAPSIALKGPGYRRMIVPNSNPI